MSRESVTGPKERVIDLIMFYLTAGNVNNARCSCTAGLKEYCNHTMGMLYLIDHVIKLKVSTFPIVGTCTDNAQQWHKPREPRAYNQNLL